MVQLARPGWLTFGSLGHPELQLFRAGFHIPIHVNSIGLQYAGMAENLYMPPLGFHRPLDLTVMPCLRNTGLNCNLFD